MEKGFGEYLEGLAQGAFGAGPAAGQWEAKDDAALGALGRYFLNTGRESEFCELVKIRPQTLKEDSGGLLSCAVFSGRGACAVQALDSLEQIGPESALRALFGVVLECGKKGGESLCALLIGKFMEQAQSAQWLRANQDWARHGQLALAESFCERGMPEGAGLAFRWWRSLDAEGLGYGGDAEHFLSKLRSAAAKSLSAESGAGPRERARCLGWLWEFAKAPGDGPLPGMGGKSMAQAWTGELFSAQGPCAKALSWAIMDLREHLDGGLLEAFAEEIGRQEENWPLGSFSKLFLTAMGKADDGQAQGKAMFSGAVASELERRALQCKAAGGAARPRSI